MALSLGVVGIAASNTAGQPTFTPTYTVADSAQWMRESGFLFSLASREDVARLIKVRDAAMLEATLALEKLSRKEYSRYDDAPHHAAKVLVAIGGGDARALAALCDNLLTLKAEDDEAGSPLTDFKAAQALVHIGGSRARRAILESLRKPVDRRGLLIRVHVLAQLDPPKIMRQHITMAIEDQEERQRIYAVAVDERYLGYLRQLRDWLNDPEFLEKPSNWP
jgi:hypothetical protein